MGYRASEHAEFWRGHSPTANLLACVHSCACVAARVSYNSKVLFPHTATCCAMLKILYQAAVMSSLQHVHTLSHECHAMIRTSRVYSQECMLTASKVTPSLMQSRHIYAKSPLPHGFMLAEQPLPTLIDCTTMISRTQSHCQQAA